MIHRYEELSWKEIDAFDRRRTMFFLPLSPLEEHGPHLPVGVDFINADFFARETAQAMAPKHPDWNFVLVPPLALGSHVIDYAGSINIRQRVIRDLVYDYGASLARHGFKFIIVFNAHAAPGHLAALEEACARVSRRYRIQMISPTGKLTLRLFMGEFYDRFNKYMPEPLAAEMLRDMRHDFHAGLWETSMMLLFRPDLVKDSYKDLVPHLKEGWEVVLNSVGSSSPSEGYLGMPASATVEFARASTRVLREEFFALLERMMAGEDVRPHSSSIYSRVPFLKVDFWSNVALLAGAITVAAAATFKVSAWLEGLGGGDGHPGDPDAEPEARQQIAQGM